MSGSVHRSGLFLLALCATAFVAALLFIFTSRRFGEIAVTRTSDPGMCEKVGPYFNDQPVMFVSCGGFY